MGTPTLKRVNGAIILENGLVPHANKLLHHIEKWSRTPSLRRANGAINIHSRGSMEPQICIQKGSNESLPKY